MPFDIRCTDCRTKLRLDEEPDPDAPIECPKCGKTFTSSAAALLSAVADKPERKSSKDGKKGKKGKKEKAPKENEKKEQAPVAMEEQERTFMNPFLLLGIILGGFLGYVVVCWIILSILGASGRVTDMLAFLPKDCAVLRGVNLGILNQYPGYKTEMDKYVTPPIAAALDGITQAMGAEDKDAMRDYMLMGLSNSGFVYIFRSKENIDEAMTVENLQGRPYPQIPGVYELPITAPGILSNALVHFPTRRHIIIAPRMITTNADASMRKTLTAIEDSDQSFVADMTDTSSVVTRTHAWLLIRAIDPYKLIITGLGNSLDKDFPALKKTTDTTTEVGMWNSFGAKVRFGGAINCASEDAAASLAKSFAEGPMGQGDSAELPNQFKMIAYFSANKEFREFLGNMSFRYQGTCAYYVSSMAGENATKQLDSVGMPKIGEAKP